MRTILNERKIGRKNFVVLEGQEKEWKGARAPRWYEMKSIQQTSIRQYFLPLIN